MSHFSQSGDLVVNLFAEIPSTAGACFPVSRHLVSLRCKADSERFQAAREPVLRQFAKAALDAGTIVELSWEAGDATARVTSVVPEVGIAELL